jgi:hypothetical protein
VAVNDATRWVKRGRIFKEGEMREEKRNTSSLSPSLNGFRGVGDLFPRKGL